MSKAKLFLYDFVTGKKIKTYLFAIIVFGAAAYFWRGNNPGLTPGTAALSNVGLSIAFMTTLYSLFSYSTMDRIKAYLMLPCTKADVFFFYIFAQYFTLLLERLSFVIIVAVFFTQSPIPILSCLLLSSLITVTLDVVFMMSLNRKRYALAVLALALIAGLYAVLTYSKSFRMNIAAMAFLLFVSVLLISAFSPKDLAIRREGKARKASLSRANYFFVIMTREKVVLINTLGLFVIAGVFAYMVRDTPFLLSVLWGVTAMNTPATTMFSGDKPLRRQERMLPRRSGLMYHIYAAFLAVYFAIANAYVVLLFALLGRFSVSVVLMGAVFTALETGLALLLERKYPLTLWQKKQEVWRNPRKYILPIIVCIFAFAPYLLGVL